MSFGDTVKIVPRNASIIYIMWNTTYVCTLFSSCFSNLDYMASILYNDVFFRNLNI
jgi:hypothetical protein